MSDEVFHLTPVDVRRREFKGALRGYDKLDVDQFREQVADELERLTRLNQELDAKAKGFFEQLKSFRERDKALNEALISAQQLRAETREQAEREAQLILREARAEAERLVASTKSELRALEEQVTSLDRTRRAYFAQLRMLVERQLADIEAAEAAMPAVQPPTPNGADGGRQVKTQTLAWLDSLLKE
jgi:DivIVA domain-containing protein